MADVHSPDQRARNMRAIRGKDTQPELKVRRLLHRSGLRYRLHRRDLPGRPDIVFPKYKGVIFLHGCFWHGHGCRLFRLPATRTEFWREKITANRQRDVRSIARLNTDGWRVMVIWECVLRGTGSWSEQALLDAIRKWLCSEEKQAELT